MEATMETTKFYIGLNVHKVSIAIAYTQAAPRNEDAAISGYDTA